MDRLRADLREGGQRSWQRAMERAGREEGAWIARFPQGVELDKFENTIEYLRDSRPNDKCKSMPRGRRPQRSNSPIRPAGLTRQCPAAMICLVALWRNDGANSNSNR